MYRLTRNGTAEPFSRDQTLRHEQRGQGNIDFPCSADHEQDWQPYPVDPYFCYTCDHTVLLGRVDPRSVLVEHTHTQAGTGTETGVETRGRTQNGNGDGSGDGNESNSEDENGDEDGNGDGNEDGIGESGGEEKKRKKPHNKSCRRHVGNGGDLGGKGGKHRQGRSGLVAANLDNLENSKEAGREAPGTHDLSKNCTRRESVSPLSRLIRGFRNKYH